MLISPILKRLMMRAAIHCLLFFAILIAVTVVAVTVDDHELKNLLAGIILVATVPALLVIVIRDFIRGWREIEA